jgi:predicted CopG family antitoxin
MTSKTISVTEDVYDELMRAKGKTESFSEFFTRMMNLQRQSLEESFGTWKLTSDELACFNDIHQREGRRWRSIDAGVEQ